MVNLFLPFGAVTAIIMNIHGRVYLCLCLQYYNTDCYEPSLAQRWTCNSGECCKPTQESTIDTDEPDSGDPKTCLDRESKPRRWQLSLGYQNSARCYH